MPFIADPSFASITINADELFLYDKDLPLEAKREPLMSNQIYDKFHVEFSSVNAQRVPGWLVIPKKGKKPFPCVLVGHGAGGSKQDFEVLYGYLASRGYASMAIDAQYHGEREVEGRQLFSGRWYEMRTVMTQTVIDSQRALDYLETIPDEIDSSRTGYIGISMGVLLGTPFVALDQRVKTAIFVVGGGDFNAIMNDSQILPFVLLRNTSGLPIHDIAEKFAPVDPVNYVARFSPRPLLMLNGKDDNVIPRSASEALFSAAGAPKDIIWFDSGHVPPFDRVMDLSTKWLNKFLKNIKPENEKAGMAGEFSGFNEGDVKLEGGISVSSDSGERIVTIEVRPEPEDAKGLPVEIVFPGIDMAFELRDDGARGDETAFDGIYSIKLPIQEILKGIIPDEIYECYARVKTKQGKIIAKMYLGNAMMREE